MWAMWAAKELQAFPERPRGRSWSGYLVTTSYDSGRKGTPEFLAAVTSGSQGQEKGEWKDGGTSWEKIWVTLWRKVGTELQGSPAGRQAGRA